MFELSNPFLWVVVVGVVLAGALIFRATLRREARERRRRARNHGRLVSKEAKRMIMLAVDTDDEKER